jgi:hypothetical protein
MKSKQHRNPLIPSFHLPFSNIHLLNLSEEMNRPKFEPQGKEFLNLFCLFFLLASFGLPHSLVPRTRIIHSSKLQKKDVLKLRYGTKTSLRLNNTGIKSVCFSTRSKCQNALIKPHFSIKQHPNPRTRTHTKAWEKYESHSRINRKKKKILHKISNFAIETSHVFQTNNNNKTLSFFFFSFRSNNRNPVSLQKKFSKTWSF